jgi:hypothetical protein
MIFAVLVLGLIVMPAGVRVNWALWTLGVWLVAGGVLLAVGHFVVEFWQAWFYTEPRLRPATRCEHWNDYPMPGAPSLEGLCVVGGLSWALATFAPVVAGVVFGGLTLVTLAYCRYARLRIWSELLPLYMAYGTRPSGAPGVWIPARSLGKRRADIAVLFIVATLVGATISVQLPWEQLLQHGGKDLSWTSEVFWNWLARSPQAP